MDSADRTELNRIVILGAGLAADNAAQTLREEWYDGQLTVVGAEKTLPYERPPLSKEVLQDEAEFATLHDADFYHEQRIDVLTGVRALDLNLSERTVGLSTGDQLGYDAALFATGASPRSLPVPGMECAYSLRTRNDEQRLHATFEPDKRLVVIGAGWIGLEVAAGARRAGLQVTLLERGPAPLHNVLGSQLAGYVRRLHESHGVDIRTGVEVTGVRPDQVVIGDEVLSADIVLAAVGAVPNTGIAEAAGLGVHDGVIADSSLQSTDPRVWVAGDVARATHTLHGPLRVEHWDNAIRQGKAAARSILGQEVKYDWQPYFFTDQFEFSMEYVGHSHPDDAVEIRGDLAANEFIAYWLGGDDGRTITAAMNVGIWDVNEQLREMIGTTVDPQTLDDLQ